MTANRSCSLEAHSHIMKRAVLTVLLLLAAPLCMTLDYSGSNIEPLVINDVEPSFSYGSNSQNLSYTTTFIQSDWNASVTALGYDNDGNLSFGGMMCAMFPAEYVARNMPLCNYQSETGMSSHQGYGPAMFGNIYRNGSLRDIEIINSSSGGDRIDDILYLSNGDYLISGWFCWGMADASGSECEIGRNGISADSYEGDDAFIARVAPNGTWLWAIGMGGIMWDTTHSLAEGPNGELFALTSFCVNSGSNSCQLASDYGTNLSEGQDDLLLMEISPGGTILWTEHMGSEYSDHGPEAGFFRLGKKGIVATSDGGVIVAGSSCEQNANCDFYISDVTLSNGSDGFLGKFDGDGDLVWAQQIGGDAVDYLQSIAKVDEHRIIVGGNHYSGQFNAGSRAIIHYGSSDSWWGIMNHTSMTWEGLWGSEDTADSFIHSVAVDARGDIILGGSGCWMNSNCMVDIAGLNQTNLTKSGFILKLDQNGTGEWLLPVVASGGLSSPINALETNQYGDIAAVSRICIDSNHNSQCSVEIGSTASSPLYRSSVVIQITQDNDLDGIYNDLDNCKDGIQGWISNITSDNDGDGCEDTLEDTDDDNDGILDYQDGCPLVSGNSSEDRYGCLDSDGDGWSDPDSTWIADDGADRYPSDSSQWRDSDGDGYGDNHYYDIDPVTGLYVNQTGDGSPLDSEQWSDMDGDGYGDNDQAGTRYDDCPYTYGLSSENDRFGCVDNDGDGWANEDDDYPFEATQWSDQDGDGYGDNPTGASPDACPTSYGTSTIVGNLGCPDIDGDGWSDSTDAFPNEPSQWNDTDGDGFGDELNGFDGDDCVNTPGNSTIGLLGCVDADGDGWADTEDDLPDNPSQWEDSDSDGYGDNPNGTNPDGCPTQAGTSYIDVNGCSDYDSDGWSGLSDVFPFDPTQWLDTDNDGYGDNVSGDYADNCPTVANGIDEDNQADHDLDGEGDACDTDDDDDGIPDVSDDCPSGITDWMSTTVTDYDQDGCLDNTEDEDDDNDGIEDDNDICQKSSFTFTSNASTDHDSDGCLDSDEEDKDDDNDFIPDGLDDCPVGLTDWRSTSGAGGTDHDVDGCKDDVEDEDDDNDGMRDEIDACPRGFSRWEAAGPNDVDQDGCIDGLESSDNQGTEVADNQYLLDLLNQSQQDEKTFVEALASGDLDAIGLVFAALLPIVGIGTTLAFRVRKGAFIRSLERTVQMAQTLEDLDQAKRTIRRAAKQDRISTNRYELMIDDLNDRRETLLQEKNDSGNKQRGSSKKTPPKRTPPKKIPDAEPEPVQNEIKDIETFTPPEDEITSGDDGYRYWEDQDGQWWIEMDGEWTQWG